VNAHVLNSGGLSENVSAFEVMELDVVILRKAHVARLNKLGFNKGANTRSEKHLSLHAHHKVAEK
jgi:hypothetical protein